MRSRVDSEDADADGPDVIVGEPGLPPVECSPKPRPQPAGAATGVPINITVTQGVAAGFPTAWPQGAWPGTSSINWSADQTIATTTATACGPLATFLVLANSVTDRLVDVIGYYQ